MDSVLESMDAWFKEALISGILRLLNNIFGAVNFQVGRIATEVGTSPSDFMPGVFNLITNLTQNVITPIAGIILTFIACYELIDLVIGHNNLANFETFIFWKWIFKTFVAVLLITNTMNITMAIFDVAQSVVADAGGIISDETSIDLGSISDMEDTLMDMDLGELIAVFSMAMIVNFLIYIIAALIYVIVYGRMIEIYLMVSLAPIPFSTFGNREQGRIGQNYLRSLMALGLQGFLIMVCVGIYAVLIQNVSLSSDLIGSLWAVLSHTILLCFTLFKTGSVAKSILHAH